MGRVTLREKLPRLLDGIAEELETNRAVWLVLFGLLYLMLVLLRSFRPLWFDEIYTYNLATLPSLRAVWNALRHGADSNPPFFHIATRAATSLFGTTELGLRIPGILGFFVLCTCLYLFVARRAGPCYGFAAMLLPWVTGAFSYASEARPYGLMLGLAGVALVGWQRAAEGRRQALSYACMSAALAAAVLTHYYGVLLLAPFGIAQIVRDYGRRRVDWAGWACLVAPLGACAVYIPIVAAVRPLVFIANSAVFLPTWHSFPDFYDFLMSPTSWPLAAGAFVVALGAAKKNKGPEAPLWRADELALAVGFLLLPMIEIIVGQLTTHVFFPRYGLPAVIGVSILLEEEAASLTGRSRLVGGALVLITVGWIVGSQAERVAVALTTPPAQSVPLDQRPDLPLVVSSGLIYYEMNHYAPPQLVARTWYLSDQQAALRITGTNVFEGFPAMDRMFPFRAKLADYRLFLKTNRHFLVYGYAVYENDWLVSKLMEDGARLTFLGRRDEEFGRAVLYEVQMPELQESSAR